MAGLLSALRDGMDPTGVDDFVLSRPDSTSVIGRSCGCAGPIIMTQTATRPWEARRTEETRLVEDALKQAGFEKVDAYRYNAASIRVRVIDPRFEGLSLEARDGKVEPILATLPEQTQADIIQLLTFAPSELQQTPKISREFFQNQEFEDPSPSML